MRQGTMFQEIAQKLQLTPEELDRESLRLFLKHRLRLVDSQIRDIARRCGVETVSEFEALVQQGQFREADAFKDLFELDRLEAEHDALVDFLRKLVVSPDGERAQE